MNGLAIVSWVIYAIALAAVIVGIVWFRRAGNVAGGILVAALSLLLGFWIAAFATPDWNPISMLAAYVPFLVGGLVGLVIAIRTRVPDERTEQTARK